MSDVVAPDDLLVRFQLIKHLSFTKHTHANTRTTHTEVLTTYVNTAHFEIWVKSDVSEDILWRHVANKNANDVYDQQLLAASS